MSSRKKKRDKRAQADESEVASTPDVEASDAEPAEQAVDTEAEVVEDAEAPAVSEISELKPRRKRKRAVDAEPEPEPEPEASESEAEEEEEEDDGPIDDTAKEAPKTRAHLKRVIESLIFVSDQVITAQQLGRITKTKIGDVREVLAELTIDYEGRGLELVEVNGGYQFRSAAASAPYVRVLVAARPVRLTRAQLETLALIAYRQPITRPEVDDVRGVDSGSAIKVLLDRELIKILGRKDDAGRPLLYGTTPFFLEFFGMNSMQELPTLREFTELSDEHRELFKAKTNDIGDPSAEAEVPLSITLDPAEPEAFEPEPEPAAESASDTGAEPIEATNEDLEADASDDPDAAEASDGFHSDAAEDAFAGESVDEAIEGEADEDAFAGDSDDEAIEGEASDESIGDDPEDDEPEDDPDTTDSDVEPS